MEPVCYFIGTTYGVLFYFFFMVRLPRCCCVLGRPRSFAGLHCPPACVLRCVQRTRMDPSASNIFNRMFNTAVKKYHARHAPDAKWCSALKSVLTCL